MQRYSPSDLIWNSCEIIYTSAKENIPRPLSPQYSLIAKLDKCSGANRLDFRDQSGSVRRTAAVIPDSFSRACFIEQQSTSRNTTNTTAPLSTTDQAFASLSTQWRAFSQASTRASFPLHHNHNRPALGSNCAARVVRPRPDHPAEKKSSPWEEALGQDKETNADGQRFFLQDFHPAQRHLPRHDLRGRLRDGNVRTKGAENGEKEVPMGKEKKGVGLLTEFF